MNQFFFNKTSQQEAKMNRFTVLESRNRLSTICEAERVGATLTPFERLRPHLRSAAAAGPTIEQLGDANEGS